MASTEGHHLVISGHFGAVDKAGRLSGDTGNFPGMSTAEDLDHLDVAINAVSTAVDGLAEMDVAVLSVGGLMRLVTATSYADRIAGVVGRAVGELQSRTGGVLPDPMDPARTISLVHWLREAARITGTKAGQQVRTATALLELALVRDAVAAGETTPAHARQLGRLVGAIEPEALRASQDALLEVAGRTDPDSLGRYVSELIATHNEPALDQQAERAEKARYFQLTNGHDGTWTGRFRLPDSAAEIIKTVLEPLARHEDLSDLRTAGQRRADALTDVFLLASRHGELPETGGLPPAVSYLVPAEWLDRHVRPCGTAEATPTEAGADATGADGTGAQALDPYATSCGRAAWTGPQTRDTIDAILCDARAARIVLEPRGQVRSLESLQDAITPSLRRALAGRDRGCVAKGCIRPPAFCDAHHVQHRADGGATDLENLVLLCRRHHVQWHRDQLKAGDLRMPWRATPVPRQRQ